MLGWGRATAPHQRAAAGQSARVLPSASAGSILGGATVMAVDVSDGARSVRLVTPPDRPRRSVQAGRERRGGRTLVSAGRTKDARRCSSAGKRVGGPEPGWQRPDGRGVLSRSPSSVSGYRRRKFRWNTRTVAHCRGGNRTTRGNRRTGWDRCVHQGGVAGNSRDTVSTSTVPAYRGSRRTRRLRLCSH
jgi:hypothetical protein